MIEADFDLNSIQATNFGVRLRSTGNMYFVPTDGPTQAALGSILQSTKHAFDGIATVWEELDISEDYGARRRIYAQRDSEFMKEMSAIFDIGALEDLPDVQDHVGDIEYYFALFIDGNGDRIVGIRKATQFKGTVKARNRLVRLVDDTLKLIQEDVLRLDEEFDILVTDDHVFILNMTRAEQVAKIVEQVAATAADKVQIIQDTLPFLDLQRIKETISQHPRVARNAASVAANPHLAGFQQEPIEALAAKHGIKFKKLPNGRLQCRVADNAKLLELLDARRYHLDLSGDGGDPYRATGRQKVATGA